MLSAAGLQDGKTFTADEPGDLVADLPTPEAELQQQPAAGTSAAATADPAAAGTSAAAAAGSAASAQAAAAAAAAAAGSNEAPNKKAKKQQAKQQKQQQKEANRQERGQTHLTFSAYDRQVLQKMAAFIREQVPFLTTAKGAIDTTLLQLLKLLAVSDVGFANLVNRLQELHHWQYYKQMLIYYSFAACVKAAEQNRRGELTAGTPAGVGGAYTAAAHTVWQHVYWHGDMCVPGMA